MKKFMINKRYTVEGTLETAENWLLQNHPEEYFGGEIHQIDDNNEPVQGGDFLLIAVLDYYKEELKEQDERNIIDFIRYQKGLSDLNYFSRNKDLFYRELKRIKAGKCINSKWNGDYYVSTYEISNKTYEHWENMELGIPSSIKLVKESD